MFEIRRKGKVIEQETLADKIEKAHKALSQADAIVIGAGAGLSTAGGITYSGPRFDENFKDFIAKYGMTDMYTAGFYPFKTEEEKWAYEKFLNEVKGKKLVFLELGVGFNTPTIIRLPFEKMVASLPDATLIRVNLSYPELMAKIEDKSVIIADDIGKTVTAICNV